MNFKFGSVVLLLTLSSGLGQEGFRPWYGEVASGPTDDDMACDTPFCVEPCPEAAPPRYCPANMTACPTGCVCMLECRSPTYVCFQTKFCMKRRRYLKRTTKYPYYYANFGDAMDQRRM